MVNTNEGFSLGFADTYSIQTRLLNSSGAGVNADLGEELAFAACDPLSELVWSATNGLSVKCTNSRTAAVEEKPFLLWNVGPSSGVRDETVVDTDDMFVDKGLRILSPGDSDNRERNGETEEAANQEAHNLQIAEFTKHTADLQPQKVPNDETSATGAMNKNETIMPISTLAPPPVDTQSRISLYKEKGKGIALDNEDDIDESVESCNSTGIFSRGIKRLAYGKDVEVMYANKRIKNQIPLCSGFTYISKSDGSFANWISNMAGGFTDFSRDFSSSFTLPCACSIDGKNLHENFPDAQNMGFQTIFPSLYSTGEEKENDYMEESRRLMVDDKKTLDDLCLSKQITVRNQARDGVISVESFGELMTNAAEKTSPKITSDVAGKGKAIGGLWVAHLRTKSRRSEKCQDIIQETIGCSTSCPKLNLESVVFPVDQKTWEIRDDSSTKTEVSGDLTNKVCSLLPRKKIESSKAMTSVFAKRLDAFRHIPSENDLKKDHQKPRLYDIVYPQNKLSDIFHAIRNLQLSRADIIRWMDSDMSLSRLNGFFLRLRLRKLDQGLEGASYYVACISTGDATEFSGCTSNKCILVDVGGIKSRITSQYVSNHDFLEDEIKDWWCKAVDRGCKVPSIDELNSKFNNRTSLGF